MRLGQLSVMSCLFLATTLSPEICRSETSVRSERSRAIEQLTSHGRLSAAIDSSKSLIAAEQGNPVGYLLLATAYYAINSQFRNDSYADSVSQTLDTTISMAERRAREDRDPTEMYFILGSAYGCRALYRSIHGGWFEALKDGVHSHSNMEKAYHRDSTFADALSGIGAYDYWKSAKAKILTSLPAGKDRRTQGIDEILRAVRARGYLHVSARRSLLAIYFNEKRYLDLLAVGDSLAADGFLDPNSRLHMARALIKLKRWAEADQALDRVLAEWESSPYYYPCSRDEVYYLKSRIYSGQGDEVKARECLKRVFDDQQDCEKSEYYKQSLSTAKDLD